MTAVPEDCSVSSQATRFLFFFFFLDSQDSNVHQNSSSPSFSPRQVFTVSLAPVTNKDQQTFFLCFDFLCHFNNLICRLF